jgi:hypothetical protein
MIHSRLHRKSVSQEESNNTLQDTVSGEIRECSIFGCLGSFS